MNYRMLKPEEWDKLKQVVEEKYIPSPDAASAAVAEDADGNLAGVLFLQIALHMEPLVLTSPKVSFEKLHKTLYDAVSDNKGLRIYAFSDKEIINSMAQHVGMEHLPGQIFVQEVR